MNGKVHIHLEEKVQKVEESSKNQIGIFRCQQKGAKRLQLFDQELLANFGKGFSEGITGM